MISKKPRPGKAPNKKVSSKQQKKDAKSRTLPSPQIGFSPFIGVSMDYIEVHGENDLSSTPPFLSFFPSSFSPSSISPKGIFNPLPRLAHSSIMSYLYFSLLFSIFPLPSLLVEWLSCGTCLTLILFSLGLSVEGIFRLSGPVSEVQIIRKSWDEGKKHPSPSPSPSPSPFSPSIDQVQS
jgi:hypothetical protein